MSIFKSFCNSNFCFLPSINIEIMKWTWINFHFLEEFTSSFPKGNTLCCLNLRTNNSWRDKKSHPSNSEPAKISLVLGFIFGENVHSFFGVYSLPYTFNIQNIKKLFCRKFQIQDLPLHESLGKRNHMLVGSELILRPNALMQKRKIIVANWLIVNSKWYRFISFKKSMMWFHIPLIMK
jgi:hypothetical protein